MYHEYPCFGNHIKTILETYQRPYDSVGAKSLVYIGVGVGTVVMMNRTDIIKWSSFLEYWAEVMENQQLIHKSTYGKKVVGDKTMSGGNKDTLCL